MARPKASILSLILVLLPLLSAGEGSAPVERDGRTAIAVVCDDNYPPYAFRDGKGRLVGIVPDQWAEWSKATGLRVELTGLPWAEALRAFDSGRADVLDTVFETPARRRVYDFTPPYAQIEVPVFIHSSVSGIRTIADLRGFRVAVKAGDAAIDQLVSLGIAYVEEYPDYQSVVEAARNLDTRIFCVDKPPALYFLYKYGIDRDYRIAFNLKGGAFRRAVRKDSGDLLGLVDRGFAAIPSSSYDRIRRDWIGLELATRVDLRLVGIVVGTLAALVLALAGIAWILRRRVAAATVELRAKIALLEQSEAEKRSFIAALPDLCFVMDREGRYLDYAVSDPSLLAAPPEAFIGRTLRELGFPGDAIGSIERGISETLETGRMTQVQYGLEIGGEGKTFEGRIVPFAKDRVLAVVRDVTEPRRQAERLARSLAEKEVLLKEIHHRVKNNLQLVSSLLTLQGRSYKDGDDRRLLAEAQQRIHSFARLHELAYDSPDLASIGLVEYLEALAHGLSSGLRGGAIEISGPRGLRIPLGEAVPLGLVANELLTNAVKYGGSAGGRIAAEARREGDELRFTVRDEGPGLPPGLDPSTSNSMGFLILRSLAAQLGGRISFSGPPGLRAELVIPYEDTAVAD